LFRTCDFTEDFGGSLGPDVGLGMAIVVVEIVHDGLLQFVDALEDYSVSKTLPRADPAKPNSISHRQDNLAREPFCAPVETHLALQLASNHVVHHARAEAPTRGRLDGRAARLRPTENEASI
jgi:hypothetical protein